MSVKVLILCQRKTGKCSNYQHLSVENEIIPKIETFLTSYLHGNDYSVEYMSSISQSNIIGTVDFDIRVENSPEFLDFLNTHKNYYSIIILQTCPFMFMKYDLIRELLCDNGVMVLSAINCGDPKLVRNRNIQMVMSNIPSLSDHFEFVNGFYIKKNDPVRTITNENDNRLLPPPPLNNLPAITNSSDPPPRPPRPPPPRPPRPPPPRPPRPPPRPTNTSGGRNITRKRKTRKRKTRSHKHSIKRKYKKNKRIKG